VEKMQGLNDDEVISVIRLGMEAYNKQSPSGQVVPQNPSETVPKNIEEVNATDGSASTVGGNKNGSV
jgi:hypothetical protein